MDKKSCHPWHTKKAIPYGQALRFRNICSEDRQFQERVGELAGWLKERSYEESLVNEQIDRVRRLDRTTLLANSGNRTNDQGRGERVPLVATYHPVLNSLGKVVRRLHPMLTNSEEHREVFPEPPLIAIRRCKNLNPISHGGGRFSPPPQPNFSTLRRNDTRYDDQIYHMVTFTQI